MSKKTQGSVQKTTQNQNASVDTQTRDWLTEIMNAARNAGTAGPSPLVSNATGYFGTGQNAGLTGIGALSGNGQDVQKLMSPYTQNVIDANATQWGRINQQTANQVRDAATMAGAFGGDRRNVALGTALNANNVAQAQQNAGLLNQGYSNAMNQAGQLAGLGFQSAGANANLGLGGVGSPNQWLFQMLRQGFIQPTGGTSGGATTTAGGTTQAGFSFPFLGGGGQL